jgi:isopentenyl phosphate kinase
MHLVLIKIGGGLITDKTSPFRVRKDMLRAASEGIRLAAKNYPNARFIVGNGAGSFGHYLASRDAGSNPEARIAAIHESVVRLNSIFVKDLRSAGLVVETVVPASCISAKHGKLENFNMERVENTLSKAKVPVLFGDIVSDGTEKGMIFSTEMLLEILAVRLEHRFEIDTLYVGEVQGVLDKSGNAIPMISTEKWKTMGSIIDAPKGYDVTGGMQHKVESALRMAKIAQSVYILSGKDPQNINAALSGADVGTKIVA